jgi:hypothetical protein
MDPGKRRRTRLLLIVVTGGLLVGCAVDVATGRGLWAWGLVGWGAIVTAVVLGAGRDNALAVTGLTAPLQRLRTRVWAADGRRNDAEWS